MTSFVILSSVILLSIYLTEQVHFLQPEYIEQLNDEISTWEAGENFPPDTPIEYLKGLLGSHDVEALAYGPFKTHDSTYDSLHYIPEKFDARKKWKHCKTIGLIREQGNCGSSWAFSTSGAFADRLCIATDGKFNELLSAEELTFCCHLCGFGCQGGHPIKAWEYFKRHGVVTGGENDSDQGCQPYRVPPCRHRISDDEDACQNQPSEGNHKCSKECYGDTEIDYKADHRYTRDAYYLTPETIKKDVMAYGPIEATVTIYNDFFNYKSGVYQKSVNATYVGAHSVKLIGWGVERTDEEMIPYWLMVNSWNEDWGDRGTFKIRRGNNECGVDNSTTGGVPVIY